MAIRFHVVGVDVGDHGEHRLQNEKRGVGLVGLRDEEFTGTEPRVGVGRQEPAADDERRVEASLGEHAGDEARRGGLAVRSRYCDPLLQPHQLGEHQRARHDRNALFARRGDLRVVRRHGGRHDDDVGACNIGLGVPDGDVRAEFDQAPRCSAVREIRAGHPISLRQ